ncbi:MAG: sulfurtransferase-like selenium metabolism protein YedF [Syntrophales bacterium]
MTIDARDFGCSLPITMAQAALSKVTVGVIEVLVGGEDVVQNLLEFANSKSMKTEVEKIENHWKVKITKGAIREAPPEEKTEPEGKGLFLIVSTDAMGKDEALGKILMRSFFVAMKAMENLPHTIFFLNAGVKLTTLEAGIYPVLKELQDNGVAIYSCGTCLKYYGLESELKAGASGSMVQTVEAMTQFRKVAWI